jgi:hypothetical protein
VIVPRINLDGATGEALSASGQDIALDHLLSTRKLSAGRLSRDYKQLLSWMSGSIRCRTLPVKFGAVEVRCSPAILQRDNWEFWQRLMKKNGLGAHCLQRLR